MKQKHKLLIPLLATITIMGGLLNVNIALSADARLYVDPPMVYAVPDESFTVDIKIADLDTASAIHEWQVNMSFDPTVLKFVNVTEGDFLLQAGQETTGQKELSNVTEGWALFSWAILGKYNVYGSGTLATVEFQVLKTGESKIDIVTEPTWIETKQKWVYMTHLTRINPPPVPPGGHEIEDIPFTATDGIFHNSEVPPVAMFTYSPETPMANEPVTFNASSSHTFGSREIIEYYWDFNDGTNGTGVTVDHTYTNGGTYNVTLTVVDNTNITGTLIETMYNTTSMPLTWFELYSSNIMTIAVKVGHDIAITDVKVSKEEVTAGETVYINVTVLNKGIETESFNVTTYYGDNVIKKKPVSALAVDAEETLPFSWDTTNVPAGDYQIRAEAADVAGEGTPQDNEFKDGTVTVKSAPESFPTTLVIGAVIAVAIIGVIAFVFLRRRKTPSA